MNIFVLDESIDNSVQYYFDDHVLKMILESGQMLCMTNYIHEVFGYIPEELDKEQRNEIKEFADRFRELDVSERPIPYLPFKRHLNHPCTLWVRQSKSNWEYLWDLICRINEEYKFRYENEEDHKTYRNLKKLDPPKDLGDKGLTEQPLAMPDECKVQDVVSSYRKYYIEKKQHLAKWTKRSAPCWYKVKEKV